MEVVAGSMRDAFGVAEQRRYAGDLKLDGVPDRRQPGNIRPSEMPTAAGIAETTTARPAIGDDGLSGAYEFNNSDWRRLASAQEAFKKAILTHPLLKDASQSITVTMIEDGLQVVLADTTGAPMFDLGATEPTPQATQQLRAIAEIVAPLPNRIFIEGHADATGAGSYSPFDLTAARANAARRILEQSGLAADRIAGVSGRASANPLYPEDPYAAGNRRIEILLEPAAPLLPADRTL